MKFNPATALEKVHELGSFNGVNQSINDSATFAFESGEDMTACFNGELEGAFLYSRHWNPTNFALAKALAAMENTEAAWVTGSGMAAITNTILQLCSAGDHIVASRTIYGGSFAFMKSYLPKFNIEVSFIDTTNLDEVKASIKPNTKMIYTETVNNPMLQVADIPKLSKIAKENNVKLVVDNTFTPMIFSPAELGADIVVYSMTKYVNGKNDTTAGAICASEEFINSLIDLNTGSSMLLGGPLDSMRSSSIHKNLYTLPIRMIQHSKNAAYLADKFNAMGLKSIYPGNENHIGNDTFKATMNPGFGFGGMIAIDLETAERASKFMTLMQENNVGYLAVSLGFFRTLFSNSGKSTSSEVPADEQKKMGLSEGLVRFSMGLDYDIEATYKTIEKCFKAL
ncbi:MAG: aminotransferase class I/II-fold pyridoxal phosphate-dependent enzyme [Bacteroidales bacterium]|nr:aminotransferase class I/II-fold pyridoxal phosphate-dependent enzyme [Bacteroidales bacterium]